MEVLSKRPSEELALEEEHNLLKSKHSAASTEKWYHDRNSRNIIIMCALTGSFMFVELIFGIMTNSLALVADAFHMFSDQLSLIIGFSALRLSKKSRSHRYSYGWIRAEVIGGLINGIFLLSVSLYIFMEAIQRFLEPPEITEPKWIMIVGGIGLLVNVIGLLLLRGQGHGGHSHGHGHSHGSESHSHSHKKKKQHKESHAVLNELDIEIAASDSDSHSNNSGHSHKQKEPRSVNIEGVFLHVLGDALGSVGAMISGACIWFLPWDHKYIIDPITSVVIGLVIMTTSIPLVRHCIRVLMQSVPDNIKLNKIEVELLKVKGILNIHDLHVWQLSDTKIVGTVHLTCPASSDFSMIASSVKKILHEHGVHSTTVQPEFVENEESAESCAITCDALGYKCEENLCCSPVKSRAHKDKTVQ